MSESLGDQKPTRVQDDTSPHRPEGKVVLEALTDAEIEKWWPLYDDTFRDVNLSNPCRQSFYKDEFAEAMKSDGMSKLAYIEDGEIVTMVLLSSDFRHFPWLSEDYFKNKYPEEFESGRIKYFVSLLTDPEKQKQGHAERILELVTELFALEGQDQIITFDCCPENASWMPDMIATIPESAGLGTLEFEEIGTQRYYAGRLVLNQSVDTAQI